MPRALVLAVMIVSGLVLLVFVLDAALGIPLRRPSLVADILFATAAAIIFYLAFETYREVA